MENAVCSEKDLWHAILAHCTLRVIVSFVYIRWRLLEAEGFLFAFVWICFYFAPSAWSTLDARDRHPRRRFPLLSLLQGRHTAFGGQALISNTRMALRISRGALSIFTAVPLGLPLATRPWIKHRPSSSVARQHC